MGTSVHMGDLAYSAKKLPYFKWSTGWKPEFADTWCMGAYGWYQEMAEIRKQGAICWQNGYSVGYHRHMWESHLKAAFGPFVLLPETWKVGFYLGQEYRFDLRVCNQYHQPMQARTKWEMVLLDGKVWKKGHLDYSVPGMTQTRIAIRTPLPEGKRRLAWLLKLQTVDRLTGKELVHDEHYQFAVPYPEWHTIPPVQLYDPWNRTRPILTKLGVPFRPVKDFAGRQSHARSGDWLQRRHQDLAGEGLAVVGGVCGGRRQVTGLAPVSPSEQFLSGESVESAGHTRASGHAGH